MNHWYPIETERLVLRPYRADDYDFLVSLMTRDDVTRYLLYDTKTPEQVRDSLDPARGPAEAAGRAMDRSNNPARP